jgi:hypothetical protein
MFDTLSMLNMESNVTELEYGPEMTFLYSLIVRGRLVICNIIIHNVIFLIAFMFQLG